MEVHRRFRQPPRRAVAGRPETILTITAVCAIQETSRVYVFLSRARGGGRFEHLFELFARGRGRDRGRGAFALLTRNRRRRCRPATPGERRIAQPHGQIEGLFQHLYRVHPSFSNCTRFGGLSRFLCQQKWVRAFGRHDYSGFHLQLASRVRRYGQRGKCFSRLELKHAISERERERQYWGNRANAAFCAKLRLLRNISNRRRASRGNQRQRRWPKSPAASRNPQAAACPGPAAYRAGRAGQHHDARVQQRADDDPQLREDGHAAQGRRHPRQVLRQDPRLGQSGGQDHQHRAGHGPQPLGRPGADRSDEAGRRHAAAVGTGDEQVSRHGREELPADPAGATSTATRFSRCC